MAQTMRVECRNRESCADLLAVLCVAAAANHAIVSTNDSVFSANGSIVSVSLHAWERCQRKWKQ
eukprot:3416222-Rhodomonas_salina.2